MQVRWLPRALRNLEQVADYIGADNPGAAARLEQRLLQSVTNLSDHPQLGRSGRVTGTRELVIPGTPYIVAYRVR